MRTLLVFVVLFAVTGVAYAETKTECSDKAYSIFQGCVEVAANLQEMGKEADLYEAWEIKAILQRQLKCTRFQKGNKDRYRSCQDRFFDETAERIVEESMQDMDPEKRKKLANSGPTTLPPEDGSDRPLEFASKLEAQKYLLKKITRKALRNTRDEMEQKQ